MTKISGPSREAILEGMEEAKKSILSLIHIIKTQSAEDVGLSDEEQFISFMIAGIMSGACTEESLALAGNFVAAIMIRDLEAKLKVQK